MPYSSVSSLPTPVRRLSEAKQRQWMATFNAVYNRTADEGRSMAAAWASVREGGNDVEKAEYQGRGVTLDKPFRTPGESKKFAVYVRDGESVKIVRFGDPDMEIRRDDPEARRNFRARHQCDTATDKTSPRYWSCRMWDDEPVSEVTKSPQFAIEAKIDKLNIEQRIVYGWASVIEENGAELIDRQGDVITPSELAKAAHKFVQSSRAAKAMHMGKPIGEIVESAVLTKDVQAALGVNLNKVGWWIGMKIHDESTWQRIKQGELRMFSIGGRGKRVPRTD